MVMNQSPRTWDDVTKICDKKNFLKTQNIQTQIADKKYEADLHGGFFLLYFITVINVTSCELWI